MDIQAPLEQRVPGIAGPRRHGIPAIDKRFVGGVRPQGGLALVYRTALEPDHQVVDRPPPHDVIDVLQARSVLAAWMFVDKDGSGREAL